VGKPSAIGQPTRPTQHLAYAGRATRSALPRFLVSYLVELCR